MRLRRMKLKICVVGERAVGKTSLIERYAKNHFSSDYHGTLGAYLYPVEVEVKADDGDLVRAKVALFDLMGEHSIRETFRDAMFYGTHGVLAVADLERPDTLYAASEWVRAVSLVTGGVPFHIALNKVDRASTSVVGPKETQWLKEEFPLARKTLTSALTGEGVEEAFSGIIGKAVDSVVQRGNRRTVKRIVRQKILAFVVRRGAAGVSKQEFLTSFKELEHNELIEEIDNLVAIDVIIKEQSGPGTFRVKATERGREIAASTLWEELVVDEPA
ncbi:MAG TPA: GTP-binding protein [Thermoplasmata archaeon]|nr:GTP-binding protein [Thermoplasmata archaeon]